MTLFKEPTPTSLSIFSTEGKRVLVGKEMAKFGLPMAILDPKKIGDADLNYPPFEPLDNSMVTAVGAWIHPTITGAAKAQLTPEQQQIIDRSTTTLDAIINLRTGQARTEFTRRIGNESFGINCGMELDEHNQPIFFSEIGSPIATTEDLQAALLAFHANLVTQIKQASFTHEP